jgi:simple sugar transport system permease protein
VAVCWVLGAGCGAGLAWGAVPAWLRIRFGVLEVISTLLLNFVAEALVSWMVTGPMQEARRAYPQSDPIAEVARLPIITGRLHLGIVLALLLAVLLWYFFARTRLGFELRAAGAGPKAAETIGRIPVTRRLAQALLVSGGIAGLAGAVEVSGVSYALFQSLSPGYGFTAIAVALLARLDPRAVVASGILFGALEAGAAGMQRDAGVPSVVVYVVEAVVIIAVLLAGRTREER